MKCIKTGFTAFIRNRDCWVHGDAFVLDKYDVAAYTFGDRPHARLNYWLVLRICAVEHHKAPSLLHGIIHADAYWFDESRTGMKHNSTMLVAPYNWEWLGYKGQEQSNG